MKRNGNTSAQGLLREWELTPDRVAIHLPTATAVLADLHLGYHSARRRRGEAVPVPALADLLAPLAAVLDQRSLSRIVVAGDLFEDGMDDNLLPCLLQWLRRQKTTLFAVVPGNHDRQMSANVPGMDVFPEGFRLQSWLVVHGHHPLPDRLTVSGHWHPSLMVGKHRLPCYLLGQQSVVLPAFCREARGVSINKAQAWQGHRCMVPVGSEVLDFGLVSEIRKRLNQTSPRRRRAPRAR